MFIVVSATEMHPRKFPCCDVLHRENGWTKLLFDSFDEARAYMSVWLYYWDLPNLVEINKMYDYNEYGDLIGIFEVNSLTELAELLK